MAGNCNSYAQMDSVSTGYLFVSCIFTHLVGVRQIKTVDGRESRRKERIELLEERDRTEEDARDPSESKDPNVRRNEDESYSEDYEANVTKMRQAIVDMADVNEKSIFLDHLQARVSLFCVDGLTDRASMDQNIIKPLLDWGNSDQEEEIPKGDALRDVVIRQVMLVAETEHAQDVKYSLQKVLFGSIVLLIEGTSGVLILGSSKGKTRGVEEPLSELVLRDPRISTPL
ncbi:spore germination protein [Paenibacillus terrae]|uniref:spore germination protein n=1 Tax=Paenibacillus terrae TaxID=159743 RepID=UPI00148582EC|nr:spore germination protein [Paenibacillus terrae]